jgi:hypothetical protein
MNLSQQKQRLDAVGVLATGANMVEYRQIPGFPAYRVGTDGSVWTCRRKGGNDRSAERLTAVWRPMKLHAHGGYLRVNLVRDGKHYSRPAHCLVLEAFVGPCPLGMEACHFPDTERSNNRLDNLRWDTRSENMRDKFRDTMGRSEKACVRCGVLKPLAEFFTDARAVDGRKTSCKPCHTEQAHATRDRDKKRLANRLWMKRYRAAGRQGGGRWLGPRS